MKKLMCPAVLIAVVLATAACGAGRDGTTQPADDEASLAVNGSGEGAELESSTSDTASDAGSPSSRSQSAPDTSRIESDLAGIDGDLAELDAELNEGSAELGRTEANPGD